MGCMREELRLRGSVSTNWSAVALMFVLLAALSGCSTAPRTSAGYSDGARDSLITQPRIELTVLIVVVDAERAGESLQFTRLREYAGVDISREGRRWARSWNDITDLVRSLRAMSAVYLLTQPSVVIRSGATATVKMQGNDRSMMAVSLGAVERPSGTVAVSIGVRFDGDERENRFEDLQFRGAALRFMDEHLFVEPDRIEGAEAQLASGQIISPAGMRMFIFVSARSISDA